MFCVFSCICRIVCKVYFCKSVYLLKPLLGHDCLRPLWPFDHVLNIMLCFYAFVLMYDIGIKFDMMMMYQSISFWYMSVHSAG